MESTPLFQNVIFGFTNLQYLILRNTDVTEDGVKEFQQSLPNCQVIFP